MNVEILSVDQTAYNMFNVMFEYNGSTVDTVYNAKRDEFTVSNAVTALIDDNLSFNSMCADLYQKFFDEYIFNNVVIKEYDRSEKTAILYYKNYNFNVKVGYTFEIDKVYDFGSRHELNVDDFKEYKKTLAMSVDEQIKLFKLNRTPNMDVQICKMYEAGIDNTQYFVRLRRNDVLSPCSFGTNTILEYACFQTKHFDKDECLRRAWSMAAYAGRFIGIENMDEVKLINFTDEEIAAIKVMDTYVAGLK